MDVEPLPYVPTWTNGRGGDFSIVKRLDHLWVVENTIVNAKNYCSWIDTDKISYHSPICLELNFEAVKGNFPFKFNHTWIGDPEFMDLVQKNGLI